MTSPASMKNGTAISGKLSAPLMMFWATICESKISSECISATPQTISANAIGMPSAMAPSSEKVKTASVTGGSPTWARNQTFSSLSFTEIRSSSEARPLSTRTRSSSRITAAETPKTRPEE